MNDRTTQSKLILDGHNVLLLSAIPIPPLLSCFFSRGMSSLPQLDRDGSLSLAVHDWRHPVECHMGMLIPLLLSRALVST